MSHRSKINMENKDKKEIIIYAVSCVFLVLITALLLYVFNEEDNDTVVATSYVIVLMACSFFGWYISVKE